MELTSHPTAGLGTAAMPKALCILGLVISVLLLVIFGLDLLTSVPFGRDATFMDIGFVVAAAILGYLSFSTMREQG
jgi:hypothetical protein